MIDFGPNFYNPFINCSIPRTGAENVKYNVTSSDFTATTYKYTVSPTQQFNINSKPIKKITLEAEIEQLRDFDGYDVNGFKISFNDKEPSETYSEINENLDPHNKGIFKKFVRPIVINLVNLMQEDNNIGK
jgi:beta-galactosidase/beta-glucuronidase